MELGVSAPKWRAPKSKDMANDIVYTMKKFVEKLFMLVNNDRTAVWPPFYCAPNTIITVFM